MSSSDRCDNGRNTVHPGDCVMHKNSCLICDHYMCCFCKKCSESIDTNENYICNLCNIKWQVDKQKDTTIGNCFFCQATIKKLEHDNNNCQYKLHISNDKTVNLFACTKCKSYGFAYNRRRYIETIKSPHEDKHIFYKSGHCGICSHEICKKCNSQLKFSKINERAFECFMCNNCFNHK